MTVYFEVVSFGATVSARLVLQGARSTQELARLNMPRSDWEDLTNCLNKPPRPERDRIVFTTTPRAAPPPADEIDFAVVPPLAEAVA